jgi:hypothetical protein
MHTHPVCIQRLVSFQQQQKTPCQVDHFAISTYKSSININCRFEAIRLHDLTKQSRLLMLPALANHHQQLGVCFGPWLVPVLLTKRHGLYSRMYTCILSNNVTNHQEKSSKPQNTVECITWIYQTNCVMTWSWKSQSLSWETNTPSNKQTSNQNHITKSRKRKKKKKSLARRKGPRKRKPINLKSWFPLFLFDSPIKSF